ncbi:MAG: hypothetical protein M3083_18140 [Actinomycetota bacterium]|nr:hypothetical protein [Actinomycetota bacterium]
MATDDRDNRAGSMLGVLADPEVGEIAGADDLIVCRMPDGTLQPVDRPASADEVHEVIQRLAASDSTSAARRDPAAGEGQ